MLTNSDQDSNQRPTMNPLSRPKIESMLRQRKDEWMEAQIWTFKADAATSVNVTFALTCNERERLTGLIVEGIEIRPK